MPLDAKLKWSFNCFNRFNQSIARPRRNRKAIGKLSNPLVMVAIHHN